ncbi:RNA polymerase sigma factor [Sandaracinus amylolyticus]|uniref:RNA polymerase sigma factor n=1 Tax=Sandaracinus amylolyticus TaxID=927083 RepID=UPI001F1862E1|nr:sigma-70 family RNA polymerase sigma factor [Sandaracinus amylolyticus]
MPDDVRQRAQTRTQSGSGPSDAALVVAARAGEAWAQEALYRRYARMVNGLAWRLMPGDPDVEDLVQDVFIQALDALDRLTEPAAFGSWIGSITIRTAHKRLRRKRLKLRLGLVRREPVDVDAVISSSAPPDVQSELRAMYRLLDELPTESRIALVLRRVEGLQLAEIAEQMGLSLATVKRRLDAAETKLSERLAVGGER